jgi:thiamine-phosphate pyrophosphorylase
VRDARLYVVLEAAAAAVVEPALRGGVDLVQLRDKEASDAELVDAAERIGALCRARGVPFVINDRPDLALAVGADGVHLGQEDAPVEEVRAEVGERLAIGLSTHSAEQIAAAEASSADYYAVGPVWETPTKPGRPAVGLELVRHAAAVASKPWFAIGGIDPSNIGLVRAAGARGVVVVRAIRDADDPEAAARALRAGLGAEAPVG